MSNGWIKLHRSFRDWYGYGDSDRVSLWLELLLLASHDKYNTIFNGKPITLEAGQLITGRKKLSKSTRVQESKVERLLKEFENQLQIEQQKTTTSRLISILNWNQYQETEQQMNNERTTDEQRMNTIQEHKNKRTKEVLSDLDFISALKTNPAYSHIDIETELGKMDSWLLTKPNRKKTRPFILRWLNRIDKPLNLENNSLPRV